MKDLNLPFSGLKKSADDFFIGLLRIRDVTRQ